MSVLFCRCESVGGDREWPVAAGSKWSGEGLLPHQQEEVSADGCSGGTQCPDHYIRYMYCSTQNTLTQLSVALETPRTLKLTFLSPSILVKVPLSKVFQHARYCRVLYNCM